MLGLRWLFILLAGLFPQFAFAADTGLDTPSLFTPPLTDKSVILLQQIFGSVGSALHGVGASHLLGELFEVFNMGIWVLAGMFVMYMTLMSVVNTAKDGQFMGRGQMSAWVVVRTVGGITALLPKFSGYSFIQVIVMWVVVQGIGLADHTWAVGLRYFEQGGTVYSQTTGGAGQAKLEAERTDVQNTLKDASLVLNSLLCQYAITRNAKLKEQAANPDVKISTSGTALPQRDDEARKRIYFPVGDAYPKYFCGYYTWANEQGDYRAAKEAGIYQVAMDLIPVATTMMKLQTGDPDVPYTAADTCLTNTAGDVADGKFCSHSNTLVTTAMEYLNILRPARLSAASGANAKRQKKIHTGFQNAASEGWIMAGKYYFSITQPVSATATLDSNFRFNTTNSFSNTNYRLLKSTARENEELALSNPVLTEFKKSLQSTCGNANNDVSCSGMASGTYRWQAAQLANSIYEQSDGAFAGLESDRSALRRKIDAAKGGVFEKAHGNILIPIIRSLVTDSLSAWAGANLASSNDARAIEFQDPIRRFRSLGERLMSNAITFWKRAATTVMAILSSTAAGFFAVTVGVAFSLGPVPGGLGPAVTSATASGFSMMFSVIMASLFWYLPVGIAISTPIFMMGMTLGVYVPLIPFIVFLFGALGWLIAVVEAMVAAPLIALGLTHPEGHDLLGKAEQSLILLLSIFLRPVAMILGFFIGIVLIFAIMQVLDAGFFQMFVEQLHSKNMKDPVTITVLSGMLIIYTFTVVAVVNQGFSLIYMLPDRLVRWIGGSPEQSAVPGLLQEVRQSAEQKAGEGASGGGQMVSAQRQSGISPGGAQAAGAKGGGGGAEEEK